MSPDEIVEPGGAAPAPGEPGPAALFEELARLDGTRTVEAEARLLSLLAHADYRVRERAVRALSRRFSPRIAAAAAAAVADDGDAGRRAAGYELLRRGGAVSRPVLVAGLGHPAADVRLAAAQLLAPWARAEAPALFDATRTEADANVRAALCLALGRTGRREALPLLLASLREGDAWTAVHALEALGELGDAEAAPRLVSLLESPALRRGALKALARLGSASMAEELLRRAAAGGELEPDFLAALAAGIEAVPAAARSRLAPLWKDARQRLEPLASDAERAADALLPAARLLALLDIPGAPLAIIRGGPGAWPALSSLRSSRLPEALLAVLQAEDPEAALVFVDRVRSSGVEATFLVPLLVHTSPAVQAAVLGTLPPGTAPIGDLLDILAEEDPESALPAALALAGAATGAEEEGRVPRGALLDRAAGPDGPGRIAALVALAGIAEAPGAAGREVDEAIRLALGSGDPATRAAAVASAGGRPGIAEPEIVRMSEDPEPSVRAAALRALVRRSRLGAPVAIGWRDILVHLADEPVVAAAAGAAVIALAPRGERADLAGDMLAQEDPVRRAALEEIPATGDVEAAEMVAIAATHEDAETARAALEAAALAGPAIRSEAATRALADPRPGVREAAARLAATLGPGDPTVGAALAAALGAEEDGGALEALLSAVAACQPPAALPPLTEILAREKAPASAEGAAAALAAAHPGLARDQWAGASARAERRWAAALERAAGASPRAGGGPGRGGAGTLPSSQSSQSSQSERSARSARSALAAVEITAAVPPRRPARDSGDA